MALHLATAKGNTSIIKTPNKAPVIVSLITALKAPIDFNFCVLKPLITTVELLHLHYLQFNKNNKAIIKRSLLKFDHS